MGCGDFVIGELIYNDLNINYTGYDAYEKVVLYNQTKFANIKKYSFVHLDFLNNIDKIKTADLCILKDVIQHWNLESIYSFLDALSNSKKFKYILIINCGYQSEHNTDIKIGEFRPLSIDYYPLKKYNPKKLYTYNRKEVSVIECQRDYAPYAPYVSCVIILLFILIFKNSYW